MNLDDTLIFDIWGNYAHFKKIYVTTSALSYGVPFKTSIFGLVGAIIGLDNTNNEYLNSFNKDNCKIAIQVINPIKFQRINLNMSDKPGAIAGNRKPTMVEFVQNPYYRIFFWHSDIELRNSLLKHLKNKTSIYTPVLGLAHCISNFNFLAYTTFKEKQGEALIDSVIPKSQLNSFNQNYWMENKIHVQEQDMYPIEMNNQREVLIRDSILFDLNGKPIKAELKSYYQAIVGEKLYNIIFM